MVKYPINSDICPSRFVAIKRVIKCNFEDTN